MITLPFTIAAVILLIAFLVSKIQYSATCLGIAAHAFFGILQTASLSVTFIFYIQVSSYRLDIVIILAIALGLIYILNFLSFVIQTGLLSQDPKFLKWLRRRQNRLDVKYNLFWFYFISVVSLLTNFKFKMILFSRLFNFDCLKCQLQRVQKFNWFNIFSFIALIPQILVLYCLFISIFQLQNDSYLYSSFIDTIIIYFTSIICSFLAAYKEPNFFDEKINGIPINKIFNVGEQSFQSSVKIGGQVAIGFSLDDIVEVNQLAYLSTIRDCTKVGKQQIKNNKYQQQSQNNKTKSANRAESDEQDKQNSQTLSNDEYPQIQSQLNNIIIINQNFTTNSQCIKQKEHQNYSQNKSKQQNLPQVQINRLKQRLEQPKSRQIVDESNQSDHQQDQRVNLADYLIGLQQKEQFGHKYDKNNIYSHPTNRKSVQQTDNLLEQITRLKLSSHQMMRNRKENKVTSSFQQEQLYFPDNQSKMNFKSQPPLRNKYQKSSNHQLTYFKTPIFRNMIQIIQKKHHSLTKTAFHQLIPNHSLTNKFDTNFHINEDHADKPVLNKNKQKIKQMVNYPIGNHSSKAIGHQYLNQQNFQLNQKKAQLKQVNRQNLKIQLAIHNNTNPVQSYVQDTKQSAVLSSTGNQDNFYMQFVKEQFIQNECKQFKRSTPINFTLFPQKHKDYINQIQESFSNHSPRKPSSLITLEKFKKFKSRQIIKDNFSWKQSSDFYNRNKSCQSRITMMTQGENRRKRSQKLQSSYSEDRHKQYALQKIYLQKMIK